VRGLKRLALQLKFPEKLETILKLKGISGLNGEFLAIAGWRARAMAALNFVK